MASAKPVRWLSVEQQRAWRAYIMGTQLLLDQLDHELRTGHGLSLSEYEILVRLSERPDGRMRMALLADALCHSRSRVTHTVSRMETAGLIQREDSPRDGRGVDAVMTPAGRRLLEEAAPTHVSGVRAHLVDLATDEDFAALGRIFDGVSDQLLTGKPAATDIR